MLNLRRNSDKFISEEFMVHLSNLDASKKIYGDGFYQHAMEIVIDRLQDQGLLAYPMKNMGATLMALGLRSAVKINENDCEAMRICEAVKHKPILFEMNQINLQIEVLAL